MAWHTRFLCMVVVFFGSLPCMGQADEGRAEANKDLKLNHIQVLGSHNSYKSAIAPALMAVIKKDNPGLARGLDYSHVSMTAQLDLGLRKLEIDVFYDPEGGRYARPFGIFGLDGIGLPAGRQYDPEGLMLEPGFKVLHIQDIDFLSNCITLKKGLEEIRAWSDGHPTHFPIVVTMNTNDRVIDKPGFTHPVPFGSEAYDALDKEFLAVFPADRIIKPDDVRGNYETLEQAVLAHNWPTLEQSRGRVMFVLDQTGDKLEAYAQGHPSLRGRMMFVDAREGRPEAAFRIVNDPIGQASYIRQLVQKGYLVRTRADAGTEEARSGDTQRREAAFASGAHFVSTDYYQPDPRFGTGYEVKLPGGGAARWNPLFANKPSFPPSETGLSRKWPEEGPKVEWTFPLGPGYGAPAVYEGDVYLLDRIDGKQDVLRCLDLRTGNEKWNYAYDAPGRVPFPGSRSVPVVDEKYVFTLGVRGDVYCFDRVTHEPLWNRSLRDEFGEKAFLTWGYAQHLLLYKDKLIVAPMASEAGVAALDPATGETLWTSPALPGYASYASPVVVTVSGEEHIVMIGALNEDIGRRLRSRKLTEDARGLQLDGVPKEELGAIVGYDPESGKQLWIYDTWQCETPVANVVAVGENRFFISGAYRAGAALFRVEKRNNDYIVEEIYQTQDFGTHVHTPVLYKGHLYGPCTSNERRDGLVCLSVDGQLKWKTERAPRFDKGGLLLADDVILIVDGFEGYVYMIDPTPKGFKPIQKAKVLTGSKIWAPLTLVEGRLLIRDQKVLKCVVVAERIR